MPLRKHRNRFRRLTFRASHWPIFLARSVGRSAGHSIALGRHPRSCWPPQSSSYLGGPSPCPVWHPDRRSAIREPPPIPTRNAPTPQLFPLGMLVTRKRSAILPTIHLGVWRILWPPL